MAKFAEYAERKLERLRLGQAACEIIHLISDPESRVALVPLIEAEYSNSLAEADKAIASEGQTGQTLRDEIQRTMVIFHASRDPNDLTEKFFSDPLEVGQLDAHEINYMYDVYLEMVALNSPSMAGLREEDFLGLRQALSKIEWSELSGQQWYAAMRFINSIQPLLLTGNYSGLSSTMKSTETSTEPDSVLNAE